MAAPLRGRPCHRFLLRDPPASEKSAGSSCGTHVRRIKSGRKLWRWQAPLASPPTDLPRDPTSPEIKVPTYWLKGVVEFTDTVQQQHRIQGMSQSEASAPRCAQISRRPTTTGTLLSTTEWNRVLITFVVKVFFCNRSIRKYVPNMQRKGGTKKVNKVSKLKATRINNQFKNL